MPKDHAGLQAFDYYLWPLQRFYERGESRYLNFVWPQTLEVLDLNLEATRKGMKSDRHNGIFNLFNSGLAYDGLGKLGTQLNLNTETVGSILVPLPPIAEQAAITDFMLRQTSRIDKRRELLAKKRELIGKLRQSLVYEAVTKGVVWDVETGQAKNLPIGWDILRIKDVAKLRSGNFIPAEKIEPAGAFPVYGGNGLRGYTDTFTHSGTFALVGRQGALCGNVNYAKGKL